MCEEECVLSLSKTKKRSDTLNSRPSKFFLYYYSQIMSKRPKRERRDLKKIKTLQKNSVLLFRENPFFFHLFHHRLKDDDEKKKRRERERERERGTHTPGARGKVARERRRRRRRRRRGKRTLSGQPKLLLLIIIIY